MAITLISTTPLTGNKAVTSITSGSISVQLGDVIAVAGTGLAGTLSVSDSNTNTWTTSYSTGTPGVVQAYATAQATTSLTVTLTSTSSTALGAVVYLIRGATTTGATSTTNTSNAGSTTPSITSASLSLGSFILGLVGVNGPTSDTVTADTDVTAGSWTTIQESGSSGGNATTNVYVLTQSKITNFSGAQTYNPVLGTARAWQADNLIILPLTEYPTSGTGAISLSGTLTGATLTLLYPVSATGAISISGTLTGATVTNLNPSTGTGSITLSATASPGLKFNTTGAGLISLVGTAQCIPALNGSGFITLTGTLSSATIKYPSTGSASIQLNGLINKVGITGTASISLVGVADSTYKVPVVGTGSVSLVAQSSNVISYAIGHVGWGIPL